MDHEEQVIYESAIIEYRTALAEAQWQLAQANGRLKYAERVNAALSHDLAEAQALCHPHGSPAGPVPPKPGPPNR